MCSTLLNDVLNEQTNNSKKLAWEEFQLKVINYNNNFGNKVKNQQKSNENTKVDADVLRVHFERFLIMNKVKNGLNTTVSDLANSIKTSYTSIYSNTTNPNNEQQNKIKMLLNTASVYTIPYQKFNKLDFEELLKNNQNQFQIMLENIFINA
jgi:hypothetical protein